MKQARKNHPWEKIFIRRDEINGEESSLGENFAGRVNYIYTSSDENRLVHRSPQIPSRMLPQAQGISANQVLAGDPSGYFSTRSPSQ